jgi:hypothetical protein
MAWQASGSKQLTTLHAVSHGWLSVEGGIEVSVEVHADMGESVEVRSACRCFRIHTDLSLQPDQPFMLQHRRYFLQKLRMLSSQSRILTAHRPPQVCFPLL